MHVDPHLGSKELSPLASRLVHGQTAKRVFNRTMDWFGVINPQLSYSIRTGIRGVAFPFRPSVIDSSPVLRDDLALYSDLYSQASANFEKVVSPYQAEIQWPPARVFNGFFETIDAELYHCMIRFLGPKRIIEVGAGNSTWFARDALRANGRGQLVAIDPDPRISPPRECHVVRQFIQDVEPSLFRELRKNDILFIDSSHTEEEATYCIENVYPALRRGVFVQIHDIVFPYRGYSSFVPDWSDLGEQEVVLEFLRHQRDSYQVFTSSAFARYQSPSMVSRLIPSKKYRPQVAGGSTWIRKKL